MNQYLILGVLSFAFVAYNAGPYVLAWLTDKKPVNADNGQRVRKLYVVRIVDVSGQAYTITCDETEAGNVCDDLSLRLDAKRPQVST